MSLVTTKPNAIHLCGSLYQFSPEAKDEILSSFKLIAGPNVNCESNESNYFRIQCPKDDDTPLFIFAGLLEDFIKKTKTKEEPDLLVGKDLPPRLDRIQGTRPNPLMNRSGVKTTQIIADTEISDEAAKLDKASNVTHDSGQPSIGSQDELNNGEFLIQHQTVTRTWALNHKGGFLSLRSKGYALGMIGALCNCGLEYTDSESMIVKIKGDYEEDIQRVMSKLQVVEKAAYERQSFPRIFSFPLLEGSLAPMLQMVALKDLKDNRVETTLLSPDSPSTSIRRIALVVTMIQAGEQVPLKQSGVQHISKEKSLWTNFPYRSFGIGNDVSQASAESAISNADSAPPEHSASPTALWVQRAGRSQYLDPFQPDPQIQEPATQAQLEGMTYRPVLEPTPIPVKPSTKRSRAARGASKAASLDNTTRVATELGLPTVTPRVVPTVSHVLGRKVQSNGVCVEAHSPSGSILVDTTPGSPTAEWTQRPFGNVAAPLIEIPRNAPPDSVPPANLIVAPMPTIQGKPGQSVEWQSNPVRSVKAGVLIDVEESRDDTTRKKEFRRTMGQRKAKTGIIASNAGMIQEFEAATRQVLDLVLLCQGSITIKVGIGRLLVNPEGTSVEFKRPFAVADWSSVFPTKDGVGGLVRETFFTPRLTTYSPDADSILNIKLSRGQSLFVGDPCERRVTYIISCLTQAKERLMIEVSADGSFKTKGSELLVGALDWHFPLRSWDSRLQITSREPLMGDYQQQAQEIVRNMKVTVDRADGQTLTFSSRTMDQELVIQSVLLRRVTVHLANNTNKDILLHLEQVQDMSVHRTSESEYHGSIQNAARMISGSKLWWEASLTSVKAATILTESEVVEFGDIGKWSPKEIIDEGIIKNLYTLANEVVTRIDSVGRKNKGPGSSSEAKTGTKARSSPITSILEGPPGMVTFW